MKYAVIGFGIRGAYYAWCLKKHDTQLVAVCDANAERLALAKKSYGVADENLFGSTEEFFQGEKKCELCVIATHDETHYEIAIEALRKGYDLLLEKPIATTVEDCEEICALAQELGRRVFVCHVLRYAPFFMTIKKELESDKYGRISTINLTENVAYWHQAHSYVRGTWRKAADSTPMIVAKYCHDLDILSWLIDKDCRYVSSMGSLNFFKRENMPEGAAERCTDCPYGNDCPYSAVNIYIRDRFEKGKVNWPCNVLSVNPTRESLTEAIEKGPGRCVFACDNDVVDHQVVNMEFDEGITAHLTMTAFSQDSYREIHVHCEYGEIYGDMIKNVLYCNIFGKESFEIDLNDLGVEGVMAGHGGGDERLIADIVNVYENKESQGLTSIERSLLSHKIAFISEQSRIRHGERLPVCPIKE